MADVTAAVREFQQAWKGALFLRRKLAEFECDGPRSDAAEWILDAAREERKIHDHAPPCWKLDKGRYDREDAWLPTPDNGWCEKCCEREKVRDDYRKATKRRGIAIRRLLQITLSPQEWRAIRKAGR